MYTFLHETQVTKKVTNSAKTLYTMYIYIYKYIFYKIL